MSPREAMCRIDVELSHVWMVRTFLKHCDEAEEEEQVQEIQRTLYDTMHALGSSWQQQDAVAYLRQIRKKFAKLRRAADKFTDIQPEISGHTNFRMAAQSLREAVQRISEILGAESDRDA